MQNKEIQKYQKNKGIIKGLEDNKIKFSLKILRNNKLLYIQEIQLLKGFIVMGNYQKKVKGIEQQQMNL